MHITFRKMHGLGNDFMVIDARTGVVNIDAKRIAELADRGTGVGFDQLLLLKPARSDEASASYEVFNADGSRVEQCGNGVRCLAKLVAGTGNADGALVVLEGIAGRIGAEVLDDGNVRVNMGEPDFAPASLPMEADECADHYTLALPGTPDTIELGAVSMGNPHAVLLCEEGLRTVPVAILGAAISSHPRFPRQTNVEFMHISDPQHVELRVFERGVGETRACGSGACAAVAVGRRWGLLEQTVQVSLPGGILEIDWDGPGQPLYMSGPAEEVYEGTIEL